MIVGCVWKGGLSSTEVYIRHTSWVCRFYSQNKEYAHQPFKTENETHRAMQGPLHWCARPVNSYNFCVFITNSSNIPAKRMKDGKINPGFETEEMIEDMEFWGGAERWKEKIGREHFENEL